jgi:hypothetical protein
VFRPDDEVRVEGPGGGRIGGLVVELLEEPGREAKGGVGLDRLEAAAEAPERGEGGR